MLLKHHVDWLGLFIARSEPLCLFPTYKVRTVDDHHSSFECKHGQVQLDEVVKNITFITPSPCLPTPFPMDVCKVYSHQW